jgi:hypothetical protein
MRANIILRQAHLRTIQDTVMIGVRISVVGFSGINRNGMLLADAETTIKIAQSNQIASKS